MPSPSHSHSRLLLAGAVAIFASGGISDVQAWTPGTGSPAAVSGFAVDSSSRRDVLAYYNTVFPASANYAASIAWTGSVASGVPGTTSGTFKDHVRRRINFYRALVGLPGDITFDATKSSKCQDAALMSARNNSLSHTPPTNWLSYTPTAAEAAGNSNLALGSYGAGSVDGYLRDDGSGNGLVGHRRWLLYSRAREMGTGDVPEDGTYNSANALWVIGNFKAAPAPRFIAWPNQGFVPANIVPARWSLSWPGASFTAATVTMTRGSTTIPTAIISRNDNGYGDNSLVWTPSGLPASVTADTSYTVTVAGLTGGGVPSSYSYGVTLFNPSVLGESVTITGPASPPVTGAAYAFNSIAQADSYELKVSTASSAAWTEGAEDSPAPQITSATTGTYALRQTSVIRTGAKAFHLAFPTFNDQSFTIVRDVIPSASSQLRFYDRGRFATTTSTLAAEVSTDNGATWTSVFSRNGVGLSSALWDANWISRNLSLAAYAGQIIQVRFILRWNNGSITTGTDPNYGFFLDDVSVTTATQLVNHRTTALAGAATAFNFDATTAAGALVAGTTYHLRVRPNVGTRWFPFGGSMIATVRAPSGYEAWVATQFPAVTGGAAGDHDRDGLTNGIEYAFGLNPTVPSSHGALPQAVRTGTTFSVNFATPPAVTGVTYGASFSPNLVNWNPVTDTGSGGLHTFTANITGVPRGFIRLTVVVAP